MIIRFSTKPNINGICYQLEIDTDKNTFKQGTFIFCSADVNGITKAQLNEIVKTIDDNGFNKINWKWLEIIMKKYNLSLMVLNNDGKYEVDKTVSTNSKYYVIKKLYNSRYDDSGSMYCRYYFGAPRIYDNNKKRFLSDYEEMIFINNDLI